MKKRIVLLSLLLSVLVFVIVFVQKKDSNQSPIHSSTTEKTIEVSETRQETKSNIKLQASEDIISENYMVQREEIRLFGVLTASRNYRNEKRPLVVVAHGFNNTLEMYEEYADYLARLGFIVYRFDFYGGSRNSKSGGTDMLSMSVLTEKMDLAAVVDQLSGESFVNADAMMLLGASQGGVVSTLYAAENPDRINKLILIFPAYVLFDDIKATYAGLGVSSMDQIPAVITHKNAQLGAIYLQDALEIDMESEIQKVTSPVLIIQGTSDEVVPYRYAVEAHRLFSDAELVTVEGGVHWIDNHFNQVAIPAIDQFLTQ